MEPATPEPDRARLCFRSFVEGWNAFQGRGTPTLHARIAGWLQQRYDARDPRLLLMVFRDAGKSTLVGLFCAWLLLREPDLRILVLAAEQTLACKMTRNIRRMIERYPPLQHLRPKRPEQWAADQLTVARELDQRDPSLMARGIGGNVTGARADIVICDDVEVPKSCATAGKRANLRLALREIGFVLVPGGLQLYVGTPHSYYSIYADEARPEAEESEPFLAGFSRLVLPIFDEHGQSRWPERFTPEHIDELRRRSGPAKFKSQMLLQPAHMQETRLDPADIVAYQAPLLTRIANGERMVTIGERRMVGVNCFWDPAYGRPGRGDSSVVAVVYKDEEGHAWLHRIEYLTLPAGNGDGSDDATRLARQVARLVQELDLPQVTIETNGIGQFLPSTLRRVLAGIGSPAQVGEHYNSRNKDMRILDTLDPLLSTGALHAHADVWRTPFIAEMRDWLPGTGSRDDGLDAVTGCILAKPAPLRTFRQPSRAGTQYQAVTNFEF